MKDDTISRKAAIDTLNVDAELLRRVLDETDIVGTERAKYEWGLGLIESYISDIKELPSAQPERKRGRWIYGEDNPGTGRDGWFCSECEHFEMWDYSVDMKSAELNLPNYCPNCGADMRGEQDE